MTKWLPTVIAAATALAAIFAPSVQGTVAAHPELSTILAAIYAIVAHFLPSPTSTSTTAAK